jgi:hypothetical protein
MFGFFKSLATREQVFWDWFKKNESRLFDHEADRDRVFDELAEKMIDVHESVTFEFGPIEDGKREFVISADGIRDAFPAVERLYLSAPKLPRWTFLKFRARRDPMGVEYGGVKVWPADVFCTIEPDRGRAGVTVYIRGYQDAQKKQYAAVAFLMLDQALGEYDVETKLGFVEVRDFEEASPLIKHPIGELSKILDAFWESNTCN